VHEHSDEHSEYGPAAVAGNVLRVARSRAAFTAPASRRGADGDLSHYTDLASGVLGEARILAAVGGYGPVLTGLLARASELLDDIDDFLIALDPLHDAEAYLLAAELHRSLEQIQARLPRRRMRWRP